jgi:transcriptional regulator with XRE-family HTH domain
MRDGEMSIEKLVGERIRDARLALGISQQELAERIEKHQITVSNYENGERLPRVGDLPRLAEVLQVPIGFFFDEEAYDHRRLLNYLILIKPRFRAVILGIIQDYVEIQDHMIEKFPELSEDDENIVTVGMGAVFQENEAYTKQEQVTWNSTPAIATTLKVRVGPKISQTDEAEDPTTIDDEINIMFMSPDSVYSSPHETDRITKIEVSAEQITLTYNKYDQHNHLLERYSKSFPIPE